MEEILSALDVALICDVEERTVRRWLKDGSLKGKQLNRWTWATTRVDVDSALASGKIRISPGKGRRPIAMLGQKALK